MVYKKTKKVIMDVKIIYLLTSRLPGFAREGASERGRGEGGREGKCSHVNVIEEFFICGL